MSPYYALQDLKKALKRQVKSGTQFAVHLHMVANGDPLGLEFVECLCGFFIQIFVTGQAEFLEDIQNALPLMATQLHLDTLHLDLLHREHRSTQVHAFIPGGSTVTRSRDAVILCRTRNVHESAAQKLRQTFTDLSTLLFHVASVHPAMSWIEPVFTPLTHYMVVVFGPPESDLTSVLVRIWMPPLIQVGAVFCPRSIDKITLLQQLRLLWLCGSEGDKCTCYINTRPLSGGSRRDVVEGDYLTCWKDSYEPVDQEVVSIPDPDDMEFITNVESHVPSRSSVLETPLVTGACGSWTA